MELMFVISVTSLQYCYTTNRGGCRQMEELRKMRKISGFDSGVN